MDVLKVKMEIILRTSSKGSPFYFLGKIMCMCLLSTCDKNENRSQQNWWQTCYWALCYPGVYEDFNLQIHFLWIGFTLNSPQKITLGKWNNRIVIEIYFYPIIEILFSMFPIKPVIERKTYPNLGTINHFSCFSQFFTSFSLPFDLGNLTKRKAIYFREKWEEIVLLWQGWQRESSVQNFRQVMRGQIRLWEGMWPTFTSFYFCVCDIS